MEEIEKLMYVYLHEVVFQVCLMPSTVGVAIFNPFFSLSLAFVKHSKRLLFLDNDDDG